MPRKSSSQDRDTANGFAADALDSTPESQKRNTVKRRQIKDEKDEKEGKNRDHEGQAAGVLDSESNIRPETQMDTASNGTLSPSRVSGLSLPTDELIAHTIHIPTDVEVKGELWRIARGEGSDASRVSALRALADIMGLMRADPPELPEAMSAYMDALARGLARP